jgi:hypothetical protein
MAPRFNKPKPEGLLALAGIIPVHSLTNQRKVPRDCLIARAYYGIQQSRRDHVRVMDYGDNSRDYCGVHLLRVVCSQRL